MLKRYVVAVFPETDSQFYEYTDSLDEAKNYAKSQAKQGYKAIIFETLYEFDPEDFTRKEEAPTGDLPNDQLPWAWIN